LSRIYSINDPGNAFRRTDGAPVKIGGIFKTDTDDSQITFTDGQGRKYWFADTTSGNVTITLPDAAEVTPDTPFVVKRVSAGANSLTVQTGGGNIDGSATKSMPTQYDTFTFVSDGTNYWIV
jgi:hypothetical protein